MPLSLLVVFLILPTLTKTTTTKNLRCRIESIKRRMLKSTKGKKEFFSFPSFLFYRGIVCAWV